MKWTRYAVLLASLATSTLPAASVDPLPQGSLVAGLTLEEWTAEWWKWQLRQHTSVSPILDTTGVCAHQSQSGPVFFIGGGVTTGGTTNYIARNITISSNLYVLFPLINWTGENVGRAVPLSPQELRDEVVTFMAATLEDRADIDGVDVPSDRILRLLAPVFSYTVPDGDNIFRYFGLDLPGMVVDPAVSDGYWVMLAPLPLGTHVIHLRGVTGAPFNVGFDAIYHVTVVEPSLAYEVGVLLSSVQCQLRTEKEPSLLASLRTAQNALEHRQWRVGAKALETFQEKLRRQLQSSRPTLVEEWSRSAESLAERARKLLQ